MAQSENDIIIDVQLNYKDTVNQIVDFQGKIAEVEKQMKSYSEQLKNGNIKDHEEYKKSLVTSKAEIAQYKDSIRLLEKELKNNLKIENEAVGSLNQLRAALSNANQQYNKLSLSERENSDDGKNLRKQINDITTELKSAEQGLQQYYRNVGNYGEATQSLKAQLKEMTAELEQMTLAGKEGSAEFQNLVEKTEEVIDAINDANESMKNTTDDIGELAGAIQLLNAGVGLFTSATNTLKLFGQESEQLNAIMEKMNAITAVLTALKVVQDAVQKKSAASRFLEITFQKIGIDLTQRQIKAEAAMNVLKGSGTIASKAAAAAQWLWNAAILANPVMLIAVAIAALIAGIILLTNNFSKSAKASKAAEQANRDYEKQAAQTAITINNINNNYNATVNDINNSVRANILVMQKQGKSAAEIAKARTDAEIKIKEETIKTNEAIIKAKNEEKNAAYSAMTAAINAQNSYKEGSKKYEEYAKKVAEATTTFNDIKKTIDESTQAVKDNALAIEEAKQKTIEETKKRNKELAALEKERRDKEVAATQQLQDAILAAMKDGLEKNIAAEKQNTERTIAELKKRIDTEKNLTKKAKEDLAKTAEQLQKNSDAKIAEMNKKNVADELQKKIDAEQKRISLSLEVATKGSQAERDLRFEQIELLREQELAEAKKTGANVNEINLKYDNRRFEVEKEAIRKQQAEKALILQNEYTALQIKAQDNAVVMAQLELEQETQRHDMLVNMDAQTKAALYESEAAYQANVLASDQKLIESKKKVAQTTAQNAANTLSSVSTMTSAMGDLFNTLAGDNEKMAGFQLALTLGQIALDTAKGIAGAVSAGAGMMFPANLAAIAAGVASVLAGIASAASAVKKYKEVKAPKFAQGGIVEMSSGGAIKGAGTATSDSIPAMLSNGESVMTAAATSMFSPVLSAFNQIGGGVPIQAQQTSQQVMGEDMLARAVARGVESLPTPVVSVQEISAVNNRVSVLENLGNS
ncbi:MAG: hypothetical protein LBS50_10355 [Prevotellaceae bacterium]|jgi:hypothetical protein|nr:hypothetical protein [Prevotellaceae bacterium]